MTLLELLVQELPKRGGWPDRVARISQDDDTEIRFYTHTGEAPEYDFYPPQKDKCGDRIIITREQYEAALAQTEWSGEGLPPVGCECEMQDAIGVFIPVDIIANHDGFAFGWNYDRHAVYFSDKRCEFRPIRSEYDKKRDEAVVELSSVIDYRNGCSSKPLA